MLTTIPCLLTFLGMTVVNFEVWAPEPIEFCIVEQYAERKHYKKLHFDCKATNGGRVGFWLEGVNKA